MRTPQEPVVPNASRWSLWLVALICFGPFTPIWVLGVLVAPFWVGVIVLELTEPEVLPGDMLWDAAFPVGLVIGGFVGLIGLVRVLTLPRQPPKSHRVFTLGMVAVGLMTLLLSLGIPNFSDLLSIGGLIYFVFPYAGAAYVLLKSRPFLFAGAVCSDVSMRGSRIRREHRDDWRLDA